MNSRRAASPWGAKRRTRENQYPEKQEAVIDAAAALFRERGYEVSLNELADRLNITKPTLYYYVKSKDHMLQLVLLRVQDEVLAFMREAVKQPGSAYERLRSIMLQYAVLMTSDYGACLSMISPEVLDPESRVQVKQRGKAAERLLTDLLLEGEADGSLRVPDPMVTQQTLFGALNWIAYWYRRGGRISPQRLAEIEVDLLLAGARGPAAAGAAEPSPGPARTPRRRKAVSGA